MREFSRKTLASEVRFSGRGLHSGTPCAVRIAPTSAGQWIKAGGDRYQPAPAMVTETLRSTCLPGVATVEHCLSALAGLGVTDFEIIVEEGNEMPALDGSSLEYVQAINEVGLEGCGTLRIDGPFRRVFVQEDGINIAIASGEGHWAYEFDAGSRFLGKTSAEYHLSPKTYTDEVAPARTFVYAEEIEPLSAMGLGQGLDHESAVIIGQDAYEFPVRFPDEPSRHKLLDLIGDLSLSGVPVAALDVKAEKSGHRTNVLAAERLLERVEIFRES